MPKEFEIKYKVVEKGNPKKILLGQTQKKVKAASETNAINEVKKSCASYLSRNGELDVVSVKEV